jgi:hypothetical protein
MVYGRQPHPFYALSNQADATHQQEAGEYLILLSCNLH